MTRTEKVITNLNLCIKLVGEEGVKELLDLYATMCEENKPDTWDEFLEGIEIDPPYEGA